METEYLSKRLEQLATEISEIMELYKIVHTSLSDEDVASMQSSSLEITSYCQIIRVLGDRHFDPIPF